MNKMLVSTYKEMKYTVSLGKIDQKEIAEIITNNYTSAAIITDKNVHKHYGDTLEKELKNNGFNVITIVLPSGERTKSLHTAKTIYKKLLDGGVQRRSVLVAFGGGMVIDTVGYIASTYMRGIPYINIATSLLAQADTAIGGKVAVNHPDGKNLIGAFYYPDHVFIDPRYLQTLSTRDMRSGFAEIIKTATISDKGLFEELEDIAEQVIKNKDVDKLTDILSKTVNLKLRLLEPDPFENDLRRVLNFGHTVGHAIEKVEAYRGIRHGEAVGVGMAIATTIAVNRGTSSIIGNRIINLIRSCGLSVTSKVDEKEVIKAMEVIRMIRNNSLNFVLPSNEIGKMDIVNNVTDQEIYNALKQLNESHK
ncbi:MAG: 3-dehydroquinate synthase [Defluviitaleaceae bacterium]|nr:3-dehydroquinate synthase [Defluviitaleaceae bacterium]